jgi:hypothetical protein
MKFTYDKSILSPNSLKSIIVRLQNYPDERLLSGFRPRIRPLDIIPNFPRSNIDFVHEVRNVKFFSDGITNQTKVRILRSTVY